MSSCHFKKHDENRNSREGWENPRLSYLPSSYMSWCVFFYALWVGLFFFSIKKIFLWLTFYPCVYNVSMYICAHSCMCLHSHTCHGRNVEVREQPWVLILTLFETGSLVSFVLFCYVYQASWLMSFWGSFCVCLPSPCRGMRIISVCHGFYMGCGIILVSSIFVYQIYHTWNHLLSSSVERSKKILLQQPSKYLECLELKLSGRDTVMSTKVMQMAHNWI